MPQVPKNRPQAVLVVSPAGGSSLGISSSISEKRGSVKPQKVGGSEVISEPRADY